MSIILKTISTNIYQNIRHEWALFRATTSLSRQFIWCSRKPSLASSFCKELIYSISITMNLLTSSECIPPCAILLIYSYFIYVCLQMTGHELVLDRENELQHMNRLPGENTVSPLLNIHWLTVLPFLLLGFSVCINYACTPGRNFPHSDVWKDLA